MSASLAGLRRARADDLSALVALQRAAYEPMGEISGGTPKPLRVDYAEVLADLEVWLLGGDPLEAALILEYQPDAVLVWSVAVAPTGESRGVGRALLSYAETRARAKGLNLMRLYTNTKFERNRAIYRQFGYDEVRFERIGDDEPPFVIVHMEKPL